jgi:hypothetical protein
VQPGDTTDLVLTPSSRALFLARHHAKQGEWTPGLHATPRSRIAPQIKLRVAHQPWDREAASPGPRLVRNIGLVSLT